MSLFGNCSLESNWVIPLQFSFSIEVDKESWSRWKFIYCKPPPPTQPAQRITHCEGVSYLTFCEWVCVRAKDNNLPIAQQFETQRINEKIAMSNPTSKYAQQNLQSTPTQLGVYVKILNQRIAAQ